jgi:hypothetical protein
MSADCCFNSCLPCVFSCIDYYLPDGSCGDALEYPCSKEAESGYSYDKRGCFVQGKFWRIPGNLIAVGGVTLLVLAILAMTKQMTLDPTLHQPFLFTGIAATGATILVLLTHYFQNTCTTETNRI